VDQLTTRRVEAGSTPECATVASQRRAAALDVLPERIDLELPTLLSLQVLLLLGD
jgi:hypothetical protein